jgi:hypothetical protein
MLVQMHWLLILPCAIQLSALRALLVLPDVAGLAGCCGSYRVLRAVRVLRALPVLRAILILQAGPNKAGRNPICWASSASYSNQAEHSLHQILVRQ